MRASSAARAGPIPGTIAISSSLAVTRSTTCSTGSDSTRASSARRSCSARCARRAASTRRTAIAAKVKIRSLSRRNIGEATQEEGAAVPQGRSFLPLQGAVVYLVSPLGDLPVLAPHAVRCGPVRRSRRGLYRALALIAVHAAVVAHIAHWKAAGRTLTPLEPSESMQTLELGYVNAGFIVFVLLILATLLLGRFFCGWACHVVAYQDLCAWLLKKAGLRPRPVRSRLLVFVPLAAAFYMFVWPRLEGLLGWRELAGSLSWHLTTSSFWKTFPGPWMGGLTLAVDGFLIVYLLGAKGFCTYGCPYGAVFGLADRFAPGKIRVTDACEGCGHCTATCTSNVRVHEEVARFGAVVDPGCMKCMDCVNVCPKDALYFGFGAPTVRIARVRKPRKLYDFTGREEIAMAGVFLAALYAFRELYHAVPFLLAIGLSVIAAVAAIAGWRLLRRRDFAFQHHPLRVAGRFTPAGALAGLLIAGLLAFLAHSAWVQLHAKQGEGLLLAAGKLHGAQRAAARERSLEELHAAERLGLFGDGILQFQLASLYRDRDDLAEAERRLERSVALSPRNASAHLALAGLALKRGDVATARNAYERVLELDPEQEIARRALAQLPAR
jgi:polyferredoxin